MTVPESIFILGTTGYIGGAIFSAIRKTYPNVPIAALVRNPSHNDAVKARGARIVQGSHSDHDIITKEASQADLVVNCADADDLPLIKAILKGMKQRKESGVKTPILIHTSGTSVVGDPPSGEATEWSKKVWNDANPEDIRSIDIKQPHRTIDVEIFEAHDRREVDAYIVCPSCIYGIGDGPVKRITQQIPNVIRAALREKKVQPTTSAYENFYFGSAGTHEWGSVAKSLAPLLHEKKRVESPEAVSIKLGSDLDFNIGNNSVSTADRGRALGWKPHHESLEESLRKDLDYILENL
ncbi:NAD(P)H-binding family protein [Ceratobasidium sp. AG-Ba]|nr:NAD(P)H-binding family protein [Ceratobasidium sp. AG-Ba]